MILFDIDGTLTTGSDHGRRSMDRAIHDVAGVAETTHVVRFHGSIDPQIVRDALTACGRWPTDPRHRADVVRAVLGRYLEYFIDGLRDAPYTALPGVREAVAAARAARAVVGLATGNIEPAAHGKLASAGLGDLFARRSDGGVGGFGDDGPTRTDMVRAAITLGRQRGSAADVTVWVVGDTPFDIEAAHEAGALAVGVATGRFDEAALRVAGAEAVYPDLRALATAAPWKG